MFSLPRHPPAPRTYGNSGVIAQKMTTENTTAQRVSAIPTSSTRRSVMALDSFTTLYSANALRQFHSLMRKRHHTTHHTEPRRELEAGKKHFPIFGDWHRANTNTRLPLA